MSDLKFYVHCFTRRAEDLKIFRDYEDLENFIESKHDKGFFIVDAGIDKNNFIDLAGDFNALGEEFSFFLLTESSKYILRKNQICNDSSLTSHLGTSLYLLEESPNYKVDLGLAEKIRSSLNKTDFKEEVLESRLNQHGFSVRTWNCLNKENISTLEELIKKSPSSLMGIKDFGKKSLQEIYSFLDIPVNGNHSHTKESFEEVYDLDFEKIRSTEILLEKDPKKKLFLKRPSETENLREFLDHSIDCVLSSRDQEIIRKRLGYSGKEMTLEDIGKEFDVTRERVRQVVDKLFKKIAYEEIILKLNKLFPISNGVLWLDNLIIEERWFKGYEENQLQIILGQLLDNTHIEERFFILRANLRSCLVKKTEKTKKLGSIGYNLDDLAVSIRGKFKKEAFKGLTLFDSQNFIEVLLDQYDLTGLTEDIFRSIKPDLYFAPLEVGSEPTLIGSGKTLHNTVVKVLYDAEKPLSVGEIKSKTEVLFGQDVPRSFGNVLTDYPKFMNFGKSLWGVAGRYSNFKEAHLNVLLNLLEEIITLDKDRQLNVDEIIFKLKKKLPKEIKEEDLTKELINTVLKDSQKVRSLSRSFWVSSSSPEKKRFKTQDIIIQALEESGVPMTNKQIKKKVMSKKSISSSFQIWEKGGVISLKSGTWGLIARDVPLRPKEIKHFQNYIKNKVIGKSGKYEIKQFYSDLGSYSRRKKSISNYLYERLCYQDPDLKHSSDKLSIEKAGEAFGREGSLKYLVSQGITQLEKNGKVSNKEITSYIEKNYKGHSQIYHINNYASALGYRFISDKDIFEKVLKVK